MQRVRGREHDAVDTRVGERLLEIRLESKGMGLPKLFDIGRRHRIDAAQHFETRALVEAADDLLAPPAEPCHGYLHCRFLLAARIRPAALRLRLRGRTRAFRLETIRHGDV